MLLGPSLPKTLKDHAMVPLDKDLVVIGGYSGDGSYPSRLYLLSCHNKGCGWTTMTQTLQVARNRFVAMLIPDELTDCSKKLSNIYLKIKTFSNNLFVHKNGKFLAWWHCFKNSNIYVRQLHDMGIFKFESLVYPCDCFGSFKNFQN